MEDEIELPQLQMELRIAPLLADKLSAPALLGVPLLLRRAATAGAASLPVPLATATAQTRGNENGITSCFSQG